MVGSPRYMQLMAFCIALQTQSYFRKILTNLTPCPQENAHDYFLLTSEKSDEYFCLGKTLAQTQKACCPLFHQKLLLCTLNHATRFLLFHKITTTRAWCGYSPVEVITSRRLILNYIVSKLYHRLWHQVLTIPLRCLMWRHTLLLCSIKLDKWRSAVFWDMSRLFQKVLVALLHSAFSLRMVSPTNYVILSFSSFVYTKLYHFVYDKHLQFNVTFSGCGV